uniref:Uncharacterized protein n=1 Tax=Rhizophora mucronata TaxID=61149 RepID=A0A2P2PVL9_RHIMU
MLDFKVHNNFIGEQAKCHRNLNKGCEI